MMFNSVIELILRGLVLCLITALMLVVLRQSAAAHRHMMCVSALAGMLSLPLAQRLMPPLRLLPPTISRLQKPVTHQSEPDPVFAEAPVQQAEPQEPISKASTFVPNPERGGPAIRSVAALNPDISNARSRNFTLVLFAIWLSGAAALLIRLIVALIRLRFLKVNSREETLGGVRVLVSQQASTPLTWGLGVRGSVILLPTALLSEDPAVCESAIRHELAHIARWDWMWNLLAELVCALCWFQPGAWWLRGRMRLESERACDDRVLLSGVAGPDYVAHLLEILQSGSTSEIAPAMAHWGGMEERMKHILDTAKPRRTNAKMVGCHSAGGIGIIFARSFASIC